MFLLGFFFCAEGLTDGGGGKGGTCPALEIGVGWGFEEGDVGWECAGGVEFVDFGLHAV